MNLPHWFTTPAGKTLCAAESRLLSAHLPELTGEVLVCASIFHCREGWHQQSPARLKVWQALAGATSNSENETCVRGALCSLPFASGTVDALIVQHGFEEAPDLSASFRESARIVREGGHVLVLLLDPWSGVGIRSLLGKLPKMPFIEPFAIHAARLLPALSLKLAFARRGLECEQEARIEGKSAKARLLIFRKRRRAADLPAQSRAGRAPEEAGLVPASRTSGAFR